MTASDLKAWRLDLGLGVIRAARLIINPNTKKPIHWRTLQRWETSGKDLPFWLTARYLARCARGA